MSEILEKILSDDNIKLENITKNQTTYPKYV